VLQNYADNAGVATKLLESPGTTHDWYTVRYCVRVGIPMILPHLGLAP
jgi:hypothetical protein